MKFLFLSLSLTFIATLTSAQISDDIWTAIEPCSDQSSTFENRLAACNAALLIDDPSELALQERASLYVQMGRYDEALQDLNEAVDRTEQTKEEFWMGTLSALWNRMVFYLEISQVELALRDMERILTESSPPIVASIQKDLQRLGTLTGEANGTFDARTMTAVEICFRDQMCYENW
jgi:tetratricopeptide (TPR) repeat protein